MKRILKPFPHLLVLGVMLTLIPFALTQEKPPSNQGDLYRVLRMERSEKDQTASCVISLPNIVDLNGLKKVICEAICGEKLDSYRTVKVQVVYGEYGKDNYRIAFYEPRRLDVLRIEKPNKITAEAVAEKFNSSTECACHSERKKEPKD